MGLNVLHSTVLFSCVCLIFLCAAHVYFAECLNDDNFLGECSGHDLSLIKHIFCGFPVRIRCVSLKLRKRRMKNLSLSRRNYYDSKNQRDM